MGLDSSLVKFILLRAKILRTLKRAPGTCLKPNITDVLSLPVGSLSFFERTKNLVKF